MARTGRVGKELSSSKYHNKGIKVKCIVSGKSLSPYCVPKRLTFSCRTKKKDECVNCKFSKKKEFKIEAVDENILKLIDISSSRTTKVLREILGIPGDCQFIPNIKEMQNIERIFILPTAGGTNRLKTELAYVSYYVGYGLEINTTYRMSGYTTIDPTNQTTTHVFTKAQKLKSDIDSFLMSKDRHSRLREFNIERAKLDDVYAYLERLYKYYAHNVTKIYDRFDLHLAVDLVFRSVLSFEFDKEFMHKGWIDAMIIGDTRCGKGFVAERLAKHYGLGEVISGENCTLSGLVGGLQQIYNHWVVTWGKIPLNDCGLVIIDEASEIKQNEWSRLSRIRSEGVAEITKIQTQITNARTRLLFLCNPPSKKVSDYSYGIQALQEVVKAPEDIARFDYALVVAHNEVSMKDINKHRGLVSPLHSTSVEQELVLWVWSRKRKDIIFSPEAVSLVYQLSIKLSKIYTFSIPLIQGENIRVKLSKIAVGFAGKLYSNKQRGKYLYVDKVHVECAFYFLQMIYKKRASGYFAVSKLQKERDMEFNERDFSVVEKYLSAFSKHKKEICRCLLMNNNITSADLAEHVNLDIVIAREVISKLLNNNCIYKQSNYYVKTPSFTDWLKNIVLKGSR